MGDVIHIAASNAKPRQHPCTTCAHFHPDTGRMGGWNRKWLFFRDGPAATAFQFASCSAYGGGYAYVERQYACHGDAWEPRDA